MSVPPVIKTERLLLRWPRAADAGAVFDSYARDEAVTRYLRRAPHRGLQETLDFMTMLAEVPADGSRLTWAITPGGDDILRGMEKAGMQFEGVMRRFTIHPNVLSEPRDAHIYAVTR